MKFVINHVVNVEVLKLYAAITSYAFSREATISRLDLSDFRICILGYSQYRLISFDSGRINEARPYNSSYWSKLNHIPHIKRFDILVYKLTDNFIHFLGSKPKF